MCEVKYPLALKWQVCPMVNLNVVYLPGKKLERGDEAMQKEKEKLRRQTSEAIIAKREAEHKLGKAQLDLKETESQVRI